MKCCDECKDYLKIPKSAISVGNEVKVTQNFPFLCKRNNLLSECEFNARLPECYIPINAKEYQSELVSVGNVTQECLSSYSFNKYVEIVINGNYVSGINFRVRRGTHSTEEILEKYDSDQVTSATIASDSFYTILGDQIIIYTKKFSVFIIDALITDCEKIFADIQKSGDCTKLLEQLHANKKSCKPRIVNLITRAYFTETNVNNAANSCQMTLRVYVCDKGHKKFKKLKKEIEKLLKKSLTSYKRLDPFGLSLCNPPELIRKQSTFQCNAVFAKEHWQELKGNLV